MIGAGMKCHLLIVATLAIVGLAISVSVAWSCSVWASLRTGQKLPEAEARRILTSRLGKSDFAITPGGDMSRGAGWLIIHAVDEGTPVNNQTHLEEPVRETPRKTARKPAPEPRPTRRPRRPRPLGIAFGPVPMNPDHTVVVVVKAGWPLVCLQGLKLVQVSETSRQNAAEPPQRLGSLGLDPKPHRLVPLEPLWGGLAANTALFASALWMVGPGPLVLRRALRRRRGQCAGCGYDLAHAEHELCPECGWITQVT